MKITRIIITLLIVFLLVGCEPPSKGITLTIGASKDLASMIPEKFSGLDITWTSSNDEVVSVTDKGVVKALRFVGGGPDLYLSKPATGSATITAKAGSLSHSITVNTTTAGQEDILKLPPMKDHFSKYFMIGNIYNPGDAATSGLDNDWLVHHFNMLTPENSMKPNSLSQARKSYNFNAADRMVNAAIADGIKVHGHTLIWHNQIPQWQRDMADADRATALSAMREYITDVMTHFKGRVYSWDVMNELFTSGIPAGVTDWKVAFRPENPWAKAIGPDFIYEGFLAARRADPNAILYYNDYNTDQRPKATIIRDMVRDVNAQYKRNFPNETRLLIEAIGMQEHHNTSVMASNIRAALELFKPLGVIISVTELDILAMGWNDLTRSTGQGANRDSSSVATNRGLITQAELYGQYMKVYLEYSDIIERVSIWGMTDDKSWRSGGLPLLFDAKDKAKPSYYYFVGALEEFESSAE